MDLNSSAWRDLVFEGKNKKYGAYYLRKTSSKRHLHALIIIVGTVSILIFSSYIWEMIKTYKEIIAQPMVDLKPVNLSELSMMEYIHPEKLENPKTETDTKNTPPKIVSDEEEIPDFVDQTEIQDIPADSIELTSADSIMLAGNKLNLSETIDEPVTYILDQTNQDKELQDLRTIISRYIYYGIKYPDTAYKQKIKGRVVYSFVVNTDGSISDITLVKGVYIFLDEEVLRTIQSIPVLKPIKKDGKPVRAKIYLPVEFII